jgi:Fe-S cluster assembly protein SufD
VSTLTSDLNDALFQDGLCVRIAAGRRLEAPLHLLHIAVPGTAAAACYPRLLVELGEGAAAHLVEEYVTVPGGMIVTNAVADVRLAAGSSLTREVVRREPARAIHLGLSRIHQERDSVLRQTEVAEVSGTLRSEVRVTLDGEGADPDLAGLAVTRGEGLADLQTLVVHARPRGTSRQLYKAILFDAARTRFLGKIQVEPEARKTSAWQMNRNLVASDAALAQSTPQLEILSDDVQCRHGSTTGQLDEEMLFYLRSRGLGAEEARDVLTRAFAREILDRLRVAAVREWIGGTLLPASSAAGEAA